MRSAEEKAEALIIGAFLFITAAIVLVIVLLDRHGAFPKPLSAAPGTAMALGGGPVPPQASNEIIQIQANLQQYARYAQNDVGGSEAAERIRGVLRQIEQNGLGSFAGRASIYEADLRRNRDCPAGADMLRIQFLASSSFGLGGIELIDRDGRMVARVAARTSSRTPLGAGIEHRLVYFYITPSQLAPDPSAVHKLLQQKEISGGVLVALQQTAGQLRARLLGSDGRRSDPVSIVVSALTPTTRPGR